MELLKKLAVTMMYIYIFVFAIYNHNLIIIAFLIFININYVKNKSKLQKDYKFNLNRQRKNFINVLNHELRIPIIAQIRALELINNENSGIVGNSQKELLTQMERSSKCLLNLMSLLINIYSMENNEYKLINEKFNISDMIKSCINELIPFAEEKNITFEYSNRSKNSNIIADKEELKKVIYNILSTSITNAFFGEKIFIIITSYNNSIRITVKGDNRSISQIETSYSPVGNNIRIDFCKKIIDFHHGKVISNDDSFAFELPMLPA